MEGVKSFWVINKTYNDVKEFHFTSDIASFVVYFKNEEIAFVLDNTCDIVSPNNLLIIAPLSEDIGKKIPATKWDSILKNKFGINPINIRPKENTKYKKLDISYTNLDLYASFSSIQSDETLDLIMQNREILSSAFEYYSRKTGDTVNTRDDKTGIRAVIKHDLTSDLIVTQKVSKINPILCDISVYYMMLFC